MTPGSIVAAWAWGTTAVATVMSQRSLKASLVFLAAPLTPEQVKELIQTLQ